MIFLVTFCLQVAMQIRQERPSIGEKFLSRNENFIYYFISCDQFLRSHNNHHTQITRLSNIARNYSKIQNYFLLMNSTARDCDMLVCAKD